ncbi:hypothetical protein BKA67DRAFT_530260 [Truncatella angustata]|uniref:DNA 3'-5' helicase n=1 Tax=Truncatella angustata TaxID=152316 RepID=A0A9P8UVR2_9PEZI|nr:uncharacterized protein BKA67DRAFT_530260 [Truncatella angustata]KAH6660144.1 hypothetical protein BKA67DRAFT_530260 [Truncatella angustata]
MTRNNLPENIAWLLANLALSTPNAPLLPAARDLPGDLSAPETLPNFLAPPLPNTRNLGFLPGSSPLVPSTKQTSRPSASHVPAATISKQSQEDLDEEGITEPEDTMGRLVPSSTRKRRSLLLQQEQSQDQLLTPASTTGVGRLQRAYSNSLRTPKAANTPAPQRQTPASKPRTPALTNDDNCETVDLTGSDDFTSSDSNGFAFGDDVRLWTEDHASRPEPAAEARGRKRKSDDISQVLDTQVDPFEDDFPDIDDFIGDTSTESVIRVTPNSSRKRNSKSNTSPEHAISHFGGSQGASQLTIRDMPSKRDVGRNQSAKTSPAIAPFKRHVSGVSPPPVKRTPSPVKRGSPMKVADDHLSPQPEGQLPRKSRRNSQVIQDSDDEWATPPTHNVSIMTVHSTSSQSRIRGGPHDLPHHSEREKSPAIIAFDTPSRRRHGDSQIINPPSSPPKQTSPRKQPSQTGLPVANIELSDDSLMINVQPLISSQPGPLPGDDVQTAILKLFLAKPSTLQRNRALVEDKLRQNRDDFRAALTGGQLGQTNILKRDKERLTRQLAALNALADEHQIYEDLVLEKDVLVEKIMGFYEQNEDTESLDERMEALVKEIKGQESLMISSLLKAGLNDVAMFEDREPSRSSRHDSVVQATQPSWNQSHSRLSGEPASLPGGNTQLIMQTQVLRRREAPITAFHALDDAPDSRYVEREKSRAISPISRPAAGRTYQEPSRATMIPAQTMSAHSMDEELYDLDDEDELFGDTPSYEMSFPNRQHIEEITGTRNRKNTAKTPAKRNETFMSEDEFDDDVDMLELAEDFEHKQSSAETDTRLNARSVFSETSGNAGASKQKTVKRVASTLAKTSFPPELMKYPWSQDVKKALKERFRMAGFRHNQLEAINTTLAGKDAFVLMPTGGGKSLCYQLPAVVKSGRTHGITIVVSPLISLMQDQVDHLKYLNIQARSFNGECKPEYRMKTLETLKAPNADQFLDLLYVTPEMINKSSAFRNALKMLHRHKKLARLVIDEAHCVSQWGHDFRPDYKELGGFRREFPNVPVMALTATATLNVIVDIQHNLGIDQCQVFSQSFNRPNLYYEVRRKEKGTVDLIAELINSKYSGQTGIVYTLSRKNAESTAQKLQAHGIAAHHYHAGIEAVLKAQIQKDWQSNKIKVVVATIAFGMGIDKPDVRFVIHQTLPKSLEGYYQETGRAGRDGQASECYLFYNYADVTQLRKMIAEGEGNEEQKDRQRNMLRTVTGFAESQSDCRRVEILRYFGESFNKAECNSTCDNCKNNGVFEMKDYTEIAMAVLEVVKRQKKLTLNQCSEILLGLQQKKNYAAMNEDTMEYFGFAKKMPKHEIHRVIDRLAAEEALFEENVFNRQVKMAFQYFFLGPNANSFLRQRRKLMLTVQVKSGDSRIKASKPKTKAAKADKQAKLPPSMLPPSTNVSSPMTKTKRQNGKGKAAVAYDEDSDEEDYEMHDNGYAKDDFVVDDDDFDEDFEEMPVSRRKRHREPAGPPIVDDAGLSSLNEVHRDMIRSFEQDAVVMAAEIQNHNNLRKAIFTRQQLRAMAAAWTLTLDDMDAIPGIDQVKVKTYGKQFLPKLKEYHAQYTDMFGQATGTSAQGINRRASQRSVVDLVSDDDDGDEMNDAGDDDEGEDGEESHFFHGRGGGSTYRQPADVQRWNAEMDNLEKNQPATSSRARSISSSKGGSSHFTRGGRKGHRKTSGASSSQRGRAGAGVRKKAPTKRASTGSARSTSSAIGSASSRGGRGSNRSAGGRQATLDMPMIPTMGYY